jgi:hypothetical protein
MLLHAFNLLILKGVLRLSVEPWRLTLQSQNHVKIIKDHPESVIEHSEDLETFLRVVKTHPIANGAHPRVRNKLSP